MLELAENGEIALGMMKGRHYDLVLMDAHMPVLDGLEATRAMREWERTNGAQPLPIVALTADAYKEAETQSAAAGFTAHLTKPIAKATLMEAIRRYSSLCDRPATLPQSIPEDSDPSSVEPEVARLAPRFLANVERDLVKLQAAGIDEDYATIQRIGHNLNGTGGSFGFPQITKLGCAMEEAAKEHSINQARSAIGELAKHMERLRSRPQFAR
jgi:CheY-like chemotaxis protein/HPt (histidine-containing phosphotransfer) domain-containing protein